MIELFDILVAIGRWLAIAAGVTLVFGGMLIGLLMWLLNRPVD
jgi:hypothetical protein